VAILLLSPTDNKNYEPFANAKWFEKTSAVIFIASIAGIGLAPYWLSTMINASLQPVIEKIMAITPF